MRPPERCVGLYASTNRPEEGMRATSTPALLLGSDVECARLHVIPPSRDDAAGGREMGSAPFFSFWGVVRERWLRRAR